MAMLKSGILAYFDTFNGLIPCRVLSVTKAKEWPEIAIQLTASRGAYKRGEKLVCPPYWVVPRDAVRVRSGNYRILPYDVQCDEVEHG